MSGLMTDLGENYEYMRTIVYNQVELKKLDLIEDISKIASMGLLFGIFSLIALFTLMSLSVLFILLAASFLGSIVYALLSYTGIIILFGLCLYIFRRTMIIRPITNIFFSLIKNRI